VLVESVVESAVESVVESVVLTLCVLDTMCFGTVGTVYFGNLFDNVCSFFLYTSSQANCTLTSVPPNTLTASSVPC
jgi:hypothetical protein